MLFRRCIVAVVAASAVVASASSDAGRAARAPRGEGVTGAVINGHHVPIREHPWQIALWRHVEFESRFVCGGAIRDSRHVVTAAHCVIDEPESFDGEPRVALPYPFRVRYGGASMNRTRRVGVAAIAVEPRFRRFAGRKRSAFAYDAAVLTLTRPIRFGKGGRAPQPIGLATESEFTRFFKRGVFVTGWGSAARRVDPPRDPLLRGAALPPWPDRSCGRVYNNGREHLFEGELMFCAGARRSGRNACRGDSGGPVTIDTKPGPRVHRKLAGIVSFGRIPCGRNGTPSVFTWVPSERLHTIRQRHPRPARSGPGLARQAIEGVRRVGHRLTCDPADHQAARATEFVWWATARNGNAKKFAEPRRTVTLPPSTRGRRVSCDVRYETAGGFFYEDMPAHRATRPIRGRWTSLAG